MELESKREEKAMPGFVVLGMAGGIRNEGSDDEEFDTALVSL